MPSADTATYIKDLIVIVFLLYTVLITLIATILGIRLYRRINRFIDRMEKVADELEITVDRVLSARKALEKAAAVFRPVMRGLGVLGLSKKIGHLFSPRNDESN